MTFTDLFIERPVLAIVLSCLLLLLGLQAADRLPLRQFPELERGVITVRTSYPGASAATVQGFVTAPLQQRIASARGIDYITSETGPGISTISVNIRLGENTTEVMSDIIARVNETRTVLPREINDPVVSSAAGGDGLMWLAFTSAQMSMEQITDYLIRTVQPELATLEGVGSADVFGDKYFAMRVWLNPAKMAAMGVTAEDVRDAIERDNVIAAAGSIKSELVRQSVEAATYLDSPATFAGIVVRQQGESRVRLGDVAEVELGGENSESASFSSGRETIFASIKTAPGANPLQVARKVREALPRITATMPADLKVFLDYDGSIYIDQALQEVVKTLIEAVVIVILVIFLFLGSLRVVTIPLVAIPLSLIGVLFLMFWMGFSINLLTLLAMVIAIGLVVDDAIVVVENVHRHIEDGAAPLQAAIHGARQVALSVIAMTLTLAAVYAPIGFLGGLTGTLFTEFALTLAGAVFVSGVIALTLSPMMCAYVLRDHDHQGRFSDWLDRAFGSLRLRYRHLLGLSLDSRGAVLLFAAVIMLSIPLLFSRAQRELAPEEDSGQIYMAANPPQYANLDYINRFVDETVAIWKKIPEVSHSWQLNSLEFVFGGMELVPWDKRDRDQSQIQQQLQDELSHISGLEIFTFAEPPLPGADAGLPVNFVIASTADYREVGRIGDEVLDAARSSGLFSFVNQSLQFSRPELGVVIDRDKAARLGISMQSIGDTLGIMLGESEINRFSVAGRSYKVIAQANKGFRLSKQWLERYYLRTRNGELVPLSTVISVQQRVEPNVLRQYQQLNSTTIQGMMTPPHSLGEGLAFLERTVREKAPAGFRIGHEGESRRFIQESRSFGLLFGISLLVIFLVLAAQFNSFRDPLIVLMAVPMSVFGAVIPIALGFVTLNIYTQVGLLTLIGLISKHGILIVDFANQGVARGLSRHDAVLEAASLRLRPILMTTAATVLGVAPLLLAFGAGAHSRFAIGLMIASGMLVGTLFTLFVVPVIYLVFSPRPQALAEDKPGVLAGS